MAAVGCISEILVESVPPRIKVGLLSSGNELVPASTKDLPPGKIRDSNKCMLIALANELPFAEVIDLGTMQDGGIFINEAITNAIDEIGCDLVITSGGVSMGELDLIKPYIELQGVVFFGRLNMKPGKPTTFGRIKDCLILALPGNPVSCFVSASLFLEPIVNMLATGKRRDKETIKAQLLPPSVKVDRVRPEYHRCTVFRYKDGFVAVSTGAA